MGDIARTAGGIAATTGAQVARTPSAFAARARTWLCSPRRVDGVPWSPDFYDTPAGLEALAPGI